MDDWRTHAACRDVDPDLFFQDTGKPSNRLIALCRGCPVLIRFGPAGLTPASEGDFKAARGYPAYMARMAGRARSNCAVGQWHWPASSVKPEDQFRTYQMRRAPRPEIAGKKGGKR